MHHQSRILDSFDSMDSSIFMGGLTTWSLKIMNLVSSGFDCGMFLLYAICGYLFVKILDAVRVSLTG